MSVAWERTHRRYELGNAVLAEVVATGSVPQARLGEIEEVFGDFGTFLQDVRRRWGHVFDTRLDALLAERPADLDRAVRDLRREVDREQPACRALLDEYADHPALVMADAHHRRVLCAVTGVDLFVRLRTA
jgi:hypothetical protein